MVVGKLDLAIWEGGPGWVAMVYGAHYLAGQDTQPGADATPQYGAMRRIPECVEQATRTHFPDCGGHRAILGSSRVRRSRARKSHSKPRKQLPRPYRSLSIGNGR